MKNAFKHFILLMLCVAVFASPVKSATVTLDINFLASGFNTGAPDDPVSGSVGITFDDTVLGIKPLTYLNLIINGIIYDISNSSAALESNSLWIGGNSLGPGGIRHGGVNDWVLALNFPDLTPDRFMYAIPSGQNTFFETSALSLTPVSEVPIPAALSLFAVSLGATGFIGWRRKRKIVVVG